MTNPLQEAETAYARGQWAQAERLCRAMIAAAPAHFDALYLLADIQIQRGRAADALANYDRALAIRPGDAAILNDRGTCLQALNRLDDALASFDKAIAARPGLAQAHFNRAVALTGLGRFDDAIASYDSALAAMPDYAEAHNNRGNVLKTLKRYDEAIASYRRALAIRPDFARALNNLGNALSELKRYDEALECFGKSLALQPDSIEALYNKGITLLELSRYEEARTSLRKASELDPEHPYALNALADCAIKLCDWKAVERLLPQLRKAISQRTSIVSPFVLLGYLNDDALQLKCTRHWVASQIVKPRQPLWRGETWRNDKIKIAYLSANYNRHAIAWLVTELIERQSRDRFEVVGVSYGPDDGSDTRARLVAAFDEFIDVQQHSDAAVAKLLHDQKIDIAVDLMGYTTDSRPGILAHRPVPIQVNHLGYPGTMGVDFIDYIIADPVTLPLGRQEFYPERIAHLPDTYQPNDSKRRIADRIPTRAEAGLPESGFVFCCFNRSYKILPPVFDAWMRLLGTIDGSMLWLIDDNPDTARNLKREAAARGIEPGRLVFASKLPLDQHLARHRVADLFLDTLPYNAHTTASDALWTGLPVLTCEGGTFAGRVGSSLVQAAGLPELVTRSLEDYETLALKLARDPALLAGIKAKLSQNLDRCALFDITRFTRNIESAYSTMWETWQRGEAPKSFAVAP